MDASNETAEQTISSSELAKDLLMELFEKNKVLIPLVAGPLTDGITIGITTLVGTMAAGPIGTCAGAAAGAAILGASKAMGHCNYKPLEQAIREDLTEEERNGLYNGVGKFLKTFTTRTNDSANQLTDSAVMDYKRSIEKNPEAMKTITNMVYESLAKKKIYFD